MPDKYTVKYVRRVHCYGTRVYDDLRELHESRKNKNEPHTQD